MTDDRPAVGATSSPLPVTRSSTSRWRLASRLARREIRRRPWRTLLVVLLVAVPVAALVAADITYRSHSESLDGGFGTASERATLSGAPATFTDEQIESRLPAGTPYAWWYESWLPLRNAETPDRSVQTVMMTIDAADPVTAGIVQVVDGRNAASPGEVALSASTADALGVRVGDALRLVRPDQTFTVVGIVRVANVSNAFIAPGFDVAALRQDVRSVVVLTGREGDGGGVASALQPMVGSTDDGSGWWFEERGLLRSVDGAGLLYGWLGGVMAMGIAGIVIAAAFAVSGRRQLVTIGQLSAAGADAPLLVRFLALQGTWAGGLGAVVGAGLGIAGTVVFRDRLGDGRVLTVRALDLAVIVLTAVVIATGAAIVPTRTIARTSVLTALGGRRPVRTVPRRVVVIGAALVVGGLLCMMFAVATVTYETYTVGVLLLFTSAVAVLSGVCLLAPAIVGLVGRLGRGLGGARRLAIRDLDRHRVRSSALLAAIIVTGAGVTAASSFAEDVRRSDGFDESYVPASSQIDVRTYIAQYSEESASSEPPPAPPVDEVAPDMRQRIEAIVGPVEWTANEYVPVDQQDPGGMALMVADEVWLRLAGVAPDAIPGALAADVIQVADDSVPPLSSDDLDRVAETLGVPRDQLEVVTVEGGAGGGGRFVSRDAVERAGITPVGQGLLGLADHDLSKSEVERLWDLSTSPFDAYYFNDVPPEDTVEVQVGASYPQRSWQWAIRWAILAASLLLVSLIVGLGLALQSAEGREERDTLVTLGARPKDVAAIAGWKALLLAGVGGLVAVPLGYLTIWLYLRAVDQTSPFPWLTALGVAIVIPVVVALGSTAASAIAQRVRPVRAVLAPVD